MTLLVSDDTVTVHVRWTGTHTGSYGGVPATNRVVDARVISIWRFVNNKVVENWTLQCAGATNSFGGTIRLLECESRCTNAFNTCMGPDEEFGSGGGDTLAPRPSKKSYPQSKRSFDTLKPTPRLPSLLGTTTTH